MPCHAQYSPLNNLQLTLYVVYRIDSNQPARFPLIIVLKHKIIASEGIGTFDIPY